MRRIIPHFLFCINFLIIIALRYNVIELLLVHKLITKEVIEYEIKKRIKQIQKKRFIFRES